jgi:PTH2 family peptidyl-tRNA hydrolase
MEAAMEDRPVKQVIVIRRDLKMRRGKEIAQGAHASMAFLAKRLGRWVAEGYEDPPGVECTAKFTRAEYEWLTGAFRKITVQVDSEAELVELEARAQAAGLTAYLITDSGLTEFHGVPTPTALAIGPDYEDLVDAVTGGLKLY